MSKKITQQQIADRYGVSQAFVSQAILGKKRSKKALKIRRAYGRAVLEFIEALTDPTMGRLAA